MPPKHHQLQTDLSIEAAILRRCAGAWHSHSPAGRAPTQPRRGARVPAWLCDQPDCRRRRAAMDVGAGWMTRVVAVAVIQASISSKVQS
jgi:hypothetical protein